MTVTDIIATISRAPPTSPDVDEAQDRVQHRVQDEDLLVGDPRPVGDAPDLLAVALRQLLLQALSRLLQELEREPAAEEAVLGVVGEDVGDVRLVPAEEGQERGGQELGEELAAIVRRRPPATGWSLLLVDGPADDLRLVEIDSDVSREPDNPGYERVLAGSARGGAGVRTEASVGPDDLRHAIHYVANVDDGPPAVPVRIELPFGVVAEGSLPLAHQRDWSSTYFDSVNIHARLGRAVEASMGSIDADWMIERMNEDGYFDRNISMHNAVLSPDTLELRVAMGRLPAIDGPFNHFGPEPFERPP